MPITVAKAFGPVFSEGLLNTQLPDSTPTLNLDFTKQLLDNRITFTRASAATDFYDPTLIYGTNTPVINSNGLLIQAARTNLLLNSAALSTQSIAVTAVGHSLSFTGTGSVTLSGAATGTLNGTGANNRVQLSFTPSAGSLTLTVTGSVTYANCGIGTFASSWIPTTGASATRAADIATITNLASIGYNPSEGTLLAEYVALGIYDSQRIVGLGVSGSATNRIEMISLITGSQTRLFATTGGVSQVDISATGLSAFTTMKSAFKYKLDDYALCNNGGTPTTDVAATVPTVDTMFIGSSTLGAFGGFIYLRKLIYYPQALNTQPITAL